jgi:anti-sigma factor ChrR (cupin superfamily)
VTSRNDRGEVGNARAAQARDAGARLRVFAELWGRGADYDRLGWEPFRDGVEIYPIYGDRGNGAAAALLRYQPGARVPRHEHSDWEHILVLHGSQADESGEYRAGTLVVNRPSSRHSIFSKEGCVVLAIWTGPVRILDQNGAE